MNLTWNVLRENTNRKCFETFNVFKHYGFLQDCIEYAKAYSDDVAEFVEHVRRSLQYYFWSKCEWEIIVSAWPPSDRIPEQKIDAYDQVMMNWEAFVMYLLENIDELQGMDETEL